VPDDSIFKLVFPQPETLSKSQWDVILHLLSDPESSRVILRDAAEKIRETLNAHPVRQKEENIPVMDGERVSGLQHKYRETVLFFPVEVTNRMSRIVALQLTSILGPILPFVLHILLPVGPVYLGRIGTAVQV
jgi:hypothetical protein